MTVTTSAKACSSTASCRSSRPDRTGESRSDATSRTTRTAIASKACSITSSSSAASLHDTTRPPNPSSPSSIWPPLKSGYPALSTGANPMHFSDPRTPATWRHLTRTAPRRWVNGTSVSDIAVFVRRFRDSTRALFLVAGNTGATRVWQSKLARGGDPPDRGSEVAILDARSVVGMYHQRRIEQTFKWRGSYNIQ